jgi:hypothetical protein
MKQTLLLLLCFATLGFASCKKADIIEDTQNRTVIFTVQPNDWAVNTDGTEYSYQYNNLGEIDNYGLATEGTLVYISYDSGKTYIQIPFVYNVDAFSYEVFNGGMRLLIQSSDQQATQALRPTTAIRVKVVIVASKDVTNL